MKNIQKMIADRKKTIDEMRSITTAAESREDKKMTEAEGVRWGELNKQVDAMKAEIDAEQRLQTLEAENATTIQSPATSVDRRKIPLGENLKAIAEKRVISGMSELVPADGGYFVNTDKAAELYKTVFEEAGLASKCRKIQISANSNAVTMNAVAESSRVSGHRWGGVNGYWLEESGLKEPSLPKFRQIELKLKKLAALCYLTDELLQDASALEGIVRQAFTEEFKWLIDEAVARGVGGGQPIGLMGHPSLVTVAIEPGQLANTVLYENVVNMYTRIVASSMPRAEWYINQTVLPQLYTMALAVGFGGVPVYMPAGMASTSPYGTLMGKPVNVTEHASALSAVGDISFLDLSQYLIAEKGGLDQASSIHVRFLNDETVLRFVIRVDGQPMWNTTIAAADGSGTTYSPFVTLAVRP